MFYRRRFFLRTMLILLLIAIFASAAGRWSYNAGWTSGYAAAQTSAESGEGEAAVAPPAQRAYPGWGFAPVGWFFAGLFKFWLFLLLVGLGLKLLFGRGPWHKRWHRGRPHPPWHGDYRHDEPREKSPEDVEPDIRSV